ncbi:MAG: hypothetical protein Q4D17_10660, partial [Planctomycetia bacterium]|nr:hypothetical protein [Planctomycetia bacterium]
MKPLAREVSPESDLTAIHWTLRNAFPKSFGASAANLRSIHFQRVFHRFDGQFFAKVIAHFRQIV